MLPVVISSGGSAATALLADGSRSAMGVDARGRDRRCRSDCLPVTVNKQQQTGRAALPARSRPIQRASAAAVVRRAAARLGRPAAIDTAATWHC